MRNKNNETDEAKAADLPDGFDVVLVPHGTTNRKLVVGKLEPGARGVVVHPNGVQKAKRWLRTQGVATAGWTSPTVKAMSMSGLPVKPDKSINAIVWDRRDRTSEQAKVVLHELGEALAELDRKQVAFRQDLRAAIAEGEAMLKDAIG